MYVWYLSQFCHRQVISKCWWMEYNLNWAKMDCLCGQYITFRWAPVRCVGLQAKHWRYRNVELQVLPSGKSQSVGEVKPPPPHLCHSVVQEERAVGHSRCLGSLRRVMWFNNGWSIWEGFLEGVTLELTMERQVWITLIYSVREWER